MHLRVLWARLFGLHRRSEADLNEELTSHLEMAAAELRAQGFSAEDAEREARLRFGGVTQARESYRTQARPPLVDSVVADVRYAARQLRRNPGYALIAIVTLAVGLGMTTAIYSLLDSILLRPLPFAQQDGLVKISGWYPKGWVQAVQQRSQTLAGVMSYSTNAEHNVDAANAPEREFGANVTVNAFAVLGVAPRLGRAFNPGESVEGPSHVVLLSDGYWKQRFAADPHVLGKPLRIDGIPFTVIGVMPPGLNFPDAQTRFWLPVSFRPNDPIDPWAMFSGAMIGRMKPGVHPQQVQAEMRALHPQLLKLFPWPMPDKWYADVTAKPLLAALVEDARSRLYLLLAAVAILLLASCANVANLMVARAATRQGEFAIRSALGASGGRLVRQMLTESLLLGAIAACLGCVVSIASLQGLKALLPADLPRLAEVHIQPQMFGFLIVLTLATTILCGLAPALRVRSEKLREGMQSAGAKHSAGREHFRLGSLLVIAQMALAVIAIAGASLMLRSLWRLVHVDPGFRTQNILSARISLDGNRCISATQAVECTAFYEKLSENLQQQPGVHRAAVVSMLPMSGEDNGWAFDAEDHPRSPSQSPDQTSNRVVSPDYFSLLGINLEQGRLFTPADSAESHAVIINRDMAQRLWPGQSALGKRLEVVGVEKQQGHLDENAMTVVGVVGHTHHATLDAPLGDEIYTPLSPSSVQPGMSVLVESASSSSVSAAAISADTLRSAVSSLNASASISQVASLSEVVDHSASSQRSLSILLGAFAVLVAGIGCIGVYSLSAYMVSARAKELGIRMALGASRSQIAALILKEGLRLAAIGGGVGLVIGLGGAYAMRSFLYATSPVDPLALAAILFALVAIAVIACSAPAWRAAHAEPLTVLRSD
jgi:predicted permease